MTDAIDLDHLGSQLERVLTEQDRIRVSAAAASAGISSVRGALGRRPSRVRRQAPGNTPRNGESRGAIQGDPGNRIVARRFVASAPFRFLGYASR